MNSLAVLKVLQDLTGPIKENNNATENSKILLDMVSSANLFSGSKLREFVRSEVFDCFKQLMVSQPTDAPSAYLCVANFQVMAFEQVYFRETYDSTSWDKLQMKMNSQFAPIFHLCSFLLSADLTETENSSADSLLKVLQFDRFSELTVDYKTLFFDLMLNHWTTLKSTLSPRKFKKLTRQLSNFVDTEGSKLKEKMVLVCNDSNGEVDGLEEPETIDASMPLKWSRLIKRYKRGGADLILRSTAGHSNKTLTDFVRQLNPTEHNESTYGCLLGIIVSWISSRPELQFAITENICNLMLGEQPNKINSLRLATAIFSDKKSGIAQNQKFLNFCMSLFVDPQIRTISAENLDLCITMTKFLIVVLHCFNPKQPIRQRSLISGCVSDLLEALHLYRKDVAIYGVKCFELEHNIAGLCKLVSHNETTAKDLPFIIANNIKAERRPSIAIINCVSNCNRHQTAFLTTNLPATERQLFSGIMKSTNLIK
ncbi:hypothetical protein M3Y98_00517800 [Aphelenchoides besseyi]|nr:hypothetical protein M3Y98_00517800 [Aphelenchoides besseyi]KAI6207915.1 hypothetical protein M3Y96_00059400 [Aphelenchoides besseyi]